MIPVNRFFLSKKGLFTLAILSFAIKMLILVYFCDLSNCNNGIEHGRIASMAGDAPSYITPIDNYLEQGEYYYENKEGKVYAGRMPYYGIVYYGFRQFLDKEPALDAVVVLQVMAEAWAIITLCLLALIFFKTSMAFWAVYAFSMISMDSSFNSLKIMPESLSISFMIFFIYFYFRYRELKKFAHLVTSAFFIAFLVALKPYFSLLYVIIFIDLLRMERFRPNMNTVRMTVRPVLIYSIVLCSLLAPWIIRNYNIYHRIIPFQVDIYAGYGYSDAYMAYRGFLKAWGGSPVFWDKRSAACYFIPSEHPCEFTFPDHAFPDSYGMKEIEDVRNDFITLQEHYSDSLDLKITSRFEQMTSQYRQERPFNYYLLSPIMLLKQFIFHSGSYYLPINAAFKCYKGYQFMIKILISMMYYLNLVLGVTGLVLLLKNNKDSFLIFSIPVLIILLFPIYLGVDEFRYFVHTYPLFTLGLAGVFSTLFARYMKNRTKSAGS